MRIQDGHRRNCPSVWVRRAVHGGTQQPVYGHILQFGSHEQKAKWLPQLASGEWIGAWGLTEANTGSDAMRMQCVAKKDGDHWVLNGTKNWITHGISGDVAVVLARTGDLLDSRGITAFVVERGTPGFAGGKKENKLGMRCSETAELVFTDCRVPEANVLGQVGEGFIQAMKFWTAAASASRPWPWASPKAPCNRPEITPRSASNSAAHCPIPGHWVQVGGHGDKHRGADLLTLQACELKNAGKPVTKESAMAKYEASEVCVSGGHEGFKFWEATVHEGFPG